MDTLNRTHGLKRAPFGIIYIYKVKYIHHPSTRKHKAGSGGQIESWMMINVNRRSSQVSLMRGHPQGRHGDHGGKNAIQARMEKIILSKTPSSNST